MFAICCVKSKTTYNRIINMFPSFEWEEYFFNIDDIRERLVFSEYNFAIVDNELHFSSELLDVFKTKDIPVIFFEKDFGDLENELKAWQAKMIVDKSANDIQPPEPPAYVSNVKIVEKVVEKIIEVPVYKSMYSPMQRRVGIFSLTERAGASFLVINLARALASRNIAVSVVELPYQMPYLFDSVGLMNSIDEENKYVSYSHIIADGSRELEKNKVLISDDISWVLMDPQLPKVNLERWNFEKTMMLLDVSRDSAVTLIDAGYSVPENTLKELIGVLDLVFVVSDCVPAEIMGNIEKLKMYKQLISDGKQVFFVLNKYNAGINKKYLLNYMDIEPLAYIPFVNPEYIYGCYYTAKIPYDKKEIKEILDPCFSTIIKNIIPPEFLLKISGETNKPKKKGLLSSFLKREVNEDE